MKETVEEHVRAVNGKPESSKRRGEIKEHRFRGLKHESTDRKTSIDQVMKQHKNHREDLENKSRRKSKIYVKTK